MRIRLATLVATPIAAIILVAAGVAGLYASAKSREATEKMSERILGDASRGVQQRVDSLLLGAETKSEVLRKIVLENRAALSATGDADQIESVLPVMRLVMLSDRNIEYLSITMASSGEFVQVYRLGPGEVLFQSNIRKETGGYVREDWEEVDGRRVFRLRDSNWKLDSRTRPYFQLAASTRRATWTSPYTFVASNGEPVVGITHATPVFDSAGNLLAVTTSDIALDGLSRYLRTVSVTPTGNAFLAQATEKGELIPLAHPSVSVTEKTSDGLKLRRFEDLEDPLALGIVRGLNPSATKPQGAKLMRVGGETRVAQATLIEHAGLNWWVFTQAPYSFFTEEYDQAMKGTGLFVLALLVCVLGLVFLITRGITRPIKSLAHQAESLQRLDLASESRLTSPIAEIDQLGGAVDQMRTSLVSFGRLVPLTYLRHLIHSGKEAVPHMDWRLLSVMFSDLEGFTGLAESVQPRELVDLLTQFLTVGNDVIDDHQGTVDKFNGDAIMAFWGAPEQQANPGAASVYACLTLHRKVKEMQIRDPRGTVLKVRSGIATGKSLVGTVGSPDRLNYTAIGDRVNLASRLQGLGKRYGEEIIIDEETAVALEDQSLVRPLDMIAVKGREGGTVILGVSEEYGDRANVSREAFREYLAGNFEEALRLYEELEKMHTNDLAARILAGRCREYKVHPPAHGWTGIVQITSK